VVDKTREKLRLITTKLPTMFWILNSEDCASNPSFCRILAYLCERIVPDLAPVMTILPHAKLSVVVFGSWICMITAAKHYAIAEGSPTFTENEIPTLGLYSAFWAGTQSSSVDNLS